MISQRISVKFFITEPQAVHLPTFIPLFHGWIQDHAVEGLLIDVADYKHVPEGPGVVLIGHEGDYSIDLANGRPGLLYSRKREWGDDQTPRLQTVFRLALEACQVIETEQRHIKFRTNEVEITFADRLHIPNQPETLDALREDLLAVLSKLYSVPFGYQGVDITLERINQNPKQPFALRIHTDHAPNLATLLRNAK